MTMLGESGLLLDQAGFLRGPTGPTIEPERRS